MIKRVAQLCIALAVMASVMSVSLAAGPASGGGGGGGGSTKPVTFRWTGIITNITVGADGASITVGTSYYAVGTGFVTSNTKIKLNGSSGATLADLRLGDTAQLDVVWPSREIVKVEATGIR
jgi:hypothetical protein